MRERVEVSCLLISYPNRTALTRCTYRPIRKHPIPILSPPYIVAEKDNNNNNEY